MKSEKKQKIQELKNWLANFGEEQQAEKAKELNIKTVNGHLLSIRNQLILFKQNKNVSIVAGFKQWKGAGKQVKKGSKSLMIFVPSVSKSKDKETQEETEYVNFYPVNVFDISQVENISEEMPQN